MRVILVPVADRPESITALKAAFDIASKVGSNVVGCHMRPDREENPTAHGALLADRAWTWTGEAGDVDLDSETAKRVFARAAEEHGFPLTKGPRAREHVAVWYSMVGSPSKLFQVAGPVSDAAVLSRPKPKGAGKAHAFLLAGLFHSARPVIVLPQKGAASIARRVVIAWNQSAEAASAVSAALPLLARAERVVVASAARESRTGPKSTALVRYLKYWGIAAERVTTRGRDPEREITQAYRDAGGDLLVMGAYSRSRLRELVFGGFTQTMLFETDVPVFMYHR